MEWAKKKEILCQLGYYFDTEEEYDNWFQWEVPYEDELKIKNELKKHCI